MEIGTEGSGADDVAVGRACQWNRMFCLKDGEYQNLTCRFWFAGMPGEPPEAGVPTASDAAGPICELNERPSE